MCYNYDKEKIPEVVLGKGFSICKGDKRVENSLCMRKTFQKALTVSKLLYFLKRRHIIALPIYITNRCNSRCRTCNIWKLKEKVDIDKSVIEELLSDEELDEDVEFILTGGEFLLHPEYVEIVRLFRGRKLRLFSNGILAEELISLVKSEKVEHLSLSLDGKPETNANIRGIDTFKNIEKIVNEVKSSTNVEIEYTISRWNSRDDLIYVINFAEKNGIGLSAGYFSEVEYFGTKRELLPQYDVSEMLSSDYYKLYNLWVGGKLMLPCFSIYVRPVVKPNGDVELCEAKCVKLGNLYERSFARIWKDEKTKALISSFKRCNGCWLNCQRTVDLAVTYIPRRLGIQF